MKIEKNSPVVFSANVDKYFAKNVEFYCMKRKLPYQYEQFNKAKERIKYYGSDNSYLAYMAQHKENGFLHCLCFKNTELNNKSALVLRVFEKYSEMLKFFSNITEDMIIEWEKGLKSGK